MKHYQVRLSHTVFGSVMFESVYASDQAGAFTAALDLNPGFVAEHATQSLQ